MSQKVYLKGYLDIPADAYDEVKKALDIHIALTREEAGCEKFDVAPDPNTANRLLVDEIFIDQAAFDAHQTRTKASPWFALTKDIKRHFTVNVGAPVS